MIQFLGARGAATRVPMKRNLKMLFLTIITKIFEFVKSAAIDLVETSMRLAHISGFQAGNEQVQTSTEKLHIGIGRGDSAQHVRARAAQFNCIQSSWVKK